MKNVSFLIPVFNEAQSLVELHQEIAAMCAANQIESEILWIDDGSTDESWTVIGQLADQHDWVRGIRLSRNFGKSAALEAGIRHSRFPYLVTLDADLQDVPGEVPKVLESLHRLDLVVGWKVDRQDRYSKRLGSRIFNRVLGLVSGVRLHDQNCGLKGFRREAVEGIDFTPGMHRFLPMLVAKQGFRVGEVAVYHRPRRFGVSKYGWKRIPQSMWDLFAVLFLEKGQLKAKRVATEPKSQSLEPNSTPPAEKNYQIQEMIGYDSN
ncbi:MAG: glycosyltransferase family 2 protein [Pirellulaceae bacterium]|nr:glycosyltransferase family 2 protein [Pirellulaceae bacterium]